MTARITYYGVRGSTPTSGPGFEKFGGNTTCLFVETEKVKIVIDAGTGIRLLGLDLMTSEFGKGQGELNMMFTHTHWDHIQGFPFFIPAYIPGNKIHIYGEEKAIRIKQENGDEKEEAWNIERTLYMQQTFMYFPASTANMAGNFEYHTIAGNQVLEFDGLTVKTLSMHHPNNTLGFRFDFENGKSFTFCTDVEHVNKMDQKIMEFAEGSEALAYDSQYTPEEYEDGKIGWGHSTYIHGSQIVKAGGIKEYHMIHHDPIHDDTFLSDLEASAKKEFAKTLMVPEKYSFEI